MDGGYPALSLCVPVIEDYDGVLRPCSGGRRLRWLYVYAPMDRGYHALMLCAQCNGPMDGGCGVALMLRWMEAILL